MHWTTPRLTRKSILYGVLSLWLLGVLVFEYGTGPWESKLYRKHMKYSVRHRADPQTLQEVCVQFGHSYVPRPKSEIEDMYAIRNGKTAVLYNYYEKNEEYINSLEYFLLQGVFEDDSTDFYLVINGEVTVPMEKVARYRNVKIWIRQNDHCADFGSNGLAMTKWGIVGMYQYYIIVNSSARGPFLPAYVKTRWTDIYTEPLGDEVKYVASHLRCNPPDDLGGHGPRLDAYAFSTDNVLLNLWVKENVFSCQDTKIKMIVHGEWALSRIALCNGYNLKSLLLRYDMDVDWRDPSNFDCNRYFTNNIGEGLYDGVSLHPLEQVFQKFHWVDPWSGNHHHVQAPYTLALTRWVFCTHREKYLELFGKYPDPPLQCELYRTQNAPDSHY